MASDRYTSQQFVEMARRLDECIEVSALCMDLALAGERHRATLAAAAAAALPANPPSWTDDPPPHDPS